MDWILNNKEINMTFYQFTELLIVDNHIMNPNVTDERVQQAREDIAKIIREYKKERPTTQQQMGEELIKAMEGVENDVKKLK